MTLRDRVAAISIGVAFFLMAILVPWPDYWHWGQELLARFLLLSISFGSFSYLIVNWR